VKPPDEFLPNELLRPPTHEPRSGWGQSLADGAPGTALLHIEHARASTGDWATVDTWIAAATRTPVAANLGSSLFLGAPAVAFALHAAQRPGYARALAALDEPINRLTHRRIAVAHSRIDQGAFPEFGEYDLIGGITGLGVHLLRRHPGGPGIREVLSYLVRLTEPLHAEGGVLPGWWTTSAPTGTPTEGFPGGHANLGMAHGIAGPLALLALAMREGITVDGHNDAITRICTWLDAWRQGTGTDAWWPPWVTREEHHAGRSVHAEPSRPSWCYGTPGVTRALQLAGLALRDTGLQDMAEDALLGCVSDPRQLAQISDAGLCHGWAGLLHTVVRATADAGAGELTTLLPDLHDRLVRWKTSAEGPGLLEGTAGVELALHSATADTPPVSGWDACLLLG
jgi:hypothetical protein